MTDQVAAFTHTCFMVAPYEGYVEVCEPLARLTPGDHAKKAALFNSGAEAVENAVKIARAHTGRDAVAVFDHAYHGRTNLTMAMTSKNMPYKHGFGPFAGEIYRAPISYPFREPTEISGAEAAARAIDVIEKQVGADNLACVVIEPVLGEGGFVVPAEGFLPAISQWCTDNGVVFVADEIQSGMCRTGAWFACEHEGVVPDLVTVAKGMAGGLPLAGVVGRAEMMDAPHAGGLGGTYGGNPVACAAALGAIATMEQLDLNAAARRIEETMTRRLRALAEKFPAIGDVRGRGAMLAVELVKPGTTEPDAALAGQDQRRLPPGRRAHPDLRHLRQRAALPAPARDARAPAGRGAGRDRGGHAHAWPERDTQPTARIRLRNCLVRSCCGSVRTSGPPRSATTPPSRNSTWSATSRANRTSWVTIASVHPSCARSLITPSTSPTSSGSSAEVGSSSRTTWGLSASARAIPTRCCWPPESCDG